MFFELCATTALVKKPHFIVFFLIIFFLSSFFHLFFYCMVAVYHRISGIMPIKVYQAGAVS